jgi:hypothetical protein
MKVKISLITLLSLLVLMGPAQLGANTRWERDGGEERAYQLDSQRAKDMESAYQALSAMLDREHYIKVIFKDLGDSYRKYALKSLSAQGTLLTIKLVHLDDDDKIKGLSLRATEIVRLELEAIPW